MTPPLFLISLQLKRVQSPLLLRRLIPTQTSVVLPFLAKTSDFSPPKSSLRRNAVLLAVDQHPLPNRLPRRLSLQHLRKAVRQTKILHRIFTTVTFQIVPRFTSPPAPSDSKRMYRRQSCPVWFVFLRTRQPIQKLPFPVSCMKSIRLRNERKKRQMNQMPQPSLKKSTKFTRFRKGSEKITIHSMSKTRRQLLHSARGIAVQELCQEPSCRTE